MTLLAILFAWSNGTVPAPVIVAAPFIDILIIVALIAEMFS
jgi:hypothetical protein